MLNETLKQRRLEVEFILGSDLFFYIQNPYTKEMVNGLEKEIFNGLEKAISLKGYRITATLKSSAGDSGCSADVHIYNISMQDMNVLSTLSVPFNSVNNTKMRLYAGNVDEEPMSLVYEGYIINAYIDTSTAPDISLSVTSNTSALVMLETVQPFSYRGEIAVTTVMQQLAQKASLRFNGNGVNTILRNPYFYGSLYDQIKKCAKSANVEWIIENGELAIWPSKGGFRKSNFTEISSLTGMIGYPSLLTDGLHLKTIFNPNLIFCQNIQVHSDVLGVANGEWTIIDLIHKLDNDLHKDNSVDSWVSEIVAHKSVAKKSD